jgi:transcriptional regulator GlxA family with amidase domain
MSAANNSEFQRVAIILLDQFSLIAYTSTIEPIRLANRVLGQDYYSWKTYSLDGAGVQASNGCTVSVDGSIADLDDADITLICSGVDVERTPLPRELGTRLRKLNARGRTYGAVCTGAYVLARFNLLDGRRCTIHWENLRSFREEFPDIEVSGDLFAIDRNCITCAGGMAALDMMLRVIAIQHGAYLAHEVAEVALYQNMRSGESAQRHDLESRTGISNIKILDAIRIMDLHIEDPCPASSLP